MQESLKWEVRQRLTLLEATVFWSGGLTTKTLTETFGISRVQASKDLTLYQRLCPGNLRYDKYLRRYVIDEGFKPCFMEGSAREFLRLLQARGDGAGPVVTLADRLPAVELVEPTVRQISLGVLRTVNQAIVQGREIEIVYQSMSRAEPRALRLNPFVLVFDGLRWHTRAFSHEHGEYRDFVLARMDSAVLLGESKVDSAGDARWHLEVTAAIAPHPGLSVTQRAVIERDYGMEEGVLRHRIRAALLPYFLQRMRIGPDDLQREANVQQIVLLNREELSDYLSFYGGG